LAVETGGTVEAGPPVPSTGAEPGAGPRHPPASDAIGNDDPGPPIDVGVARADLESRVQGLESELAELRGELVDLRDSLGGLRHSLGE
jgi:hypothetical protein